MPHDGIFSFIFTLNRAHTPDEMASRKTKVDKSSQLLLLSSYSVTETAAVVKAPVAGRVHAEGFCGESSNSTNMDSLQKQ